MTLGLLPISRVTAAEIKATVDQEAGPKGPAERPRDRIR
jgi:hypothetical protein